MKHLRVKQLPITRWHDIQRALRRGGDGCNDGAKTIDAYQKETSDIVEGSRAPGRNGAMIAGGRRSHRPGAR